jgi:ubiquinone/menaquinone biosynthesis C-methylase UbiE
MQSNLSFRLMSIEFRLRDWFDPPVKILLNAGVAPEMTVLDFGCGPGGFSLAAAHLVGSGGRVYAVDIHPLALRRIEKAVDRLGLVNLHAVQGDHLRDLKAGSIDLVLFYDILHDLPDPGGILRKMHRLLKSSGNASVKDHRLSADQIKEYMTKEGLYRPGERGKKTWPFERMEPAGGTI